MPCLPVDIVTIVMTVFPEPSFALVGHVDYRSPLDPAVDPGCNMNRQSILCPNQDQYAYTDIEHKLLSSCIAWVN